MVPAAADGRLAGQDSRGWRRLFRAVLDKTSLACRWLWGGAGHGRKALALEAEAEEQRLTHSLLLASMRAEFYVLARRHGLNLDETALDEMLEQAVALCGRLWTLERRQGSEIGAAVENMERARVHATAANRLMEPALGHHVALQWVE